MKLKIVRKLLIYITLISLIISAFILLSQSTKSTDFKSKKIKILIVAGHEPNAGGADEFKKIKERDLNLQLAIQLKNNLSKNTNIEVIMARNENGWNKDLESYIMTGSSTIMKWVKEMKDKMTSKVGAGEMNLIDPNMKHNDAANNAVLFLYGTNKWIVDTDIDLVFHIHFNNNPKINGKPNFRGYCMYVPDKQYSNASSSKIFAEYLNEEISKIEKKSNMKQELKTIIPDQQLIAIGNYDTLKIPSVVVEYAYIYEPVMLSSSTRNNFIKTAASSTSIAIEKYVNDIWRK